MSVYSHSRLTSYENCPLKYRLRYVDEVDIERRETVESFVGRRVHETLQYLHDRHTEGALLTLQEILTHLDNAWEREWHPRVLVVRAGRRVGDYRDMATRCVTNYYRLNHPFNRGVTVGTELAVVFVLDFDRDVHIKGYIDRLVRLAPGMYEIHDYKTSRRMPSQAYLDRDRQLALYQMAIHQMMADARQVRLVWHYLAHGRNVRSTRTPESLDVLRRDTLRLIDRIERATRRRDFPAFRSALCDWCDFRAMCPAWAPVQTSIPFPAAEPEPAGSLG
ncbi:MAG TPA: PD-(D/E)XK nuclease family protein [Candidatus Eisenbacteria bacterium]|nr:PD-(D/E)XK nuclease family protein [Candidatus Eisenbacteria bacterium]